MSSNPLQFPALDQAIAKFEGFGTPDVYATINNNPGNLVGSSGQGGFQSFPTVQQGVQAEDNLVSSYASQGYSLGDLLSVWSQTTADSGYQQGIAKMLGTSLDTPASSLQGQQSDSWLTSPLGNPFGLPPFLDPGSEMTPTLPNTPMGGPATPGQATGSSWGRVASGLIGLIVIAGGIFLFADKSIDINVVKGLVASAVE